ncbi:MAG TPA: hypothetical protein DCR12_05780 [Lachnospiraceae bacterium]|nr:hypothetical protein [Lachnospiraceae bacterium]
MNEQGFLAALKGVKVPILVLDQKWHRLFAVSGKPKEIIENEAELKTLLAEQGKLTTELKEYKKAKNNLMHGIVQNMEGVDSTKHVEEAQNLNDNRRLMEESKKKIEEIEDRLLELPKQIKIVNEKLMLDTMSFCYEKLRTNSSEIEEISGWITEMRIELKKNLIRKQNREINNREIYVYMNDIFGKDVMNLFDVKYEDYEQNLKANEMAVQKAKAKALEKAKEEEEKAKKLEDIKAD